MCLGVPMRVIETTGLTARCDAKGIQRDVSLFLLQHEPIAAGDHVIVHVGYAIQKISEVEARGAWEIYDAMLEAEDREAGGA
ncbi:MAG: HypC/HybG/HupF family hydrogenase formation chaperone [Gammaproteobacteria bacterium]|nr:HypC/HybG/HupF family hydrogenase formation chaperone [Gammaproteobacteria bacterium]